MFEVFVCFIFGFLCGVCISMILMDPTRQYIKELEKEKTQKDERISRRIR